MDGSSMGAFQGWIGGAVLLILVKEFFRDSRRRSRVCDPTFLLHVSYLFKHVQFFPTFLVFSVFFLFSRLVFFRRVQAFSDF